MTPGTRIGPYEVIASLGAGGMGEVYRARDTRLGRDVALKVLPRDFSADPDRLARLEREARALAALNHPHIAAIYGLEDVDHATGAETPGRVRALVLELVEGETLADRIHGSIGRGRGRGLSIGDALTIARQIAEALDAAHEKGIVHRDLKPANIKVTPQDQVKVLDFGLAKLMPASEVADAASATVEATSVGLVVGTAAYMSPEQARGQAVDKRTDIWAFGCVLFEMLTGRVAFARETTTDTLAAILEREPDWSTLPTDIPAALRRVLNRCLHKDPRHRLRDAGDVRIQLEDVLTTPDSSPPQQAVRVRSLGWALVAAAFAAVAVGAVAVWSVTGRQDPPTREIVLYSIDLQQDEELPVASGLPLPVAISSNGQQVAYSVRNARGTRLYIRRHDVLDRSPIAGTEGGIGPFFSPDGAWLGFVSGGVLRKVPVAGGSPQTIAEAPNLLDASWGVDDTIVYARWGGGLFRVSARGGTPESLTTLADSRREIRHRSPHVIADRAVVLFTVDRQSLPSQIDAVDIATGVRHTLVDGANPFFSKGQLVFERDGTLMAAPLDIARLALTGPPIRSTEEVWAQDRSLFAASAEGSLVYVPTIDPSRRRLVWVDRSGQTSPVTNEPHAFGHPRVSPDGSRVLVTVGSPGGNEFWIYDTLRGTRARLSVTGGTRPIWTPDGKRITFQKARALFSIPADDSNAPELVLGHSPPASSLFPLAWSRDGRFLLYSRPTPETNRDLFILPTGGVSTPFLATPRDERAAMFSPDGRWVVYAMQEPGRDEEVYVQPYSGEGTRLVISRGGGVEPVWSPTGKEIYYRSIDGRRMMAVDVEVRAGSAIRVGNPRTMFEGPFPAMQGSFWSNYDVTPDGQRFLMVEASEDRRARLNVVLHWIDQLQRPEDSQPQR